MHYITLNNNQKFPLIGTGTNTFGKEDNQYMGQITFDTTLIEQALKIGYRLIDTAISYRNEGVVGLAITKTNIKRSDIIITTKIPGTPEYRSASAVNEAVEQSLKTLKLDYIDLMLIHHPWENDDEMVLVWKTLEENVGKGKVRAIGLSNFNEEQTKLILKNANIKPVINQIESHPGKWQHALIAFLKEHDIVPEAWGPLSRVTPEMKETLTNIGKKYNKTWAQVILNYQVSRGVIVIPKSHRYEGQNDNFAIFDFTLTDGEKETISKL